MGVDIGSKRGDLMKGLAILIAQEDERVEVEYCELEKHRCSQCSHEIECDGYKVRYSEEDLRLDFEFHGLVYFHHSCYWDFLDSSKTRVSKG